jgi:hypothetical protein
MSLRYIVPALGAVALAAPAAHAVDVGGLTINGYVDTILNVTVTDVGHDDTAIDFTGAAQLEIGYKIGDKVEANVEVFWTDNSTSTLQQAYVSYAVDDQLSLTMGLFHNWIGWEGLDAPDLYRINNSNMFAGRTWWGNDVTGLAVNYAVSDELNVAFYLTDGVFTPISAGRPDEAIAIGINANYTMADVGVFDVDLTYDQKAGGVTAPSKPDDFLLFDVNAEINALRESDGLLLAGDIFYADWDTDSAMGIMVMGNYDLKDALPVPASVTLMIDYFELDKAANSDELEVAIALLTNPTSDSNFGVNVELAYVDVGATTGDKIGLYFEALAVIP